MADRATTMTRNKRKAEATQSPGGRSAKRRVEADDGQEGSVSDEQEDAGRMDSQAMLSSAIKILKYSDDGWINKTRAEFGQDQKALNALLDGKERELADVDSQFHNQIRRLLTDVLGGPRAKPEKKTNTQDTARPRPAHDHAQLLFAKSVHLVEKYNKIASGLAMAEHQLATDHLQALEKDKTDVAELLHLGSELARRQVEQVLERRGRDNPPRNKIRPLFTDERLREAASLFDSLRNQAEVQDEDPGSDHVCKLDMSKGDGLFPLVHNVKKGIKKIAGHLLLDDEC